MNLKNYVILGISVALCLLTGCGAVSSPKEPTLNIYQTPILRLKAGTEVETLDGLYKAQEREIWHSDYRYRELERKVLSQ